MGVPSTFHEKSVQWEQHGRMDTQTDVTEVMCIFATVRMRINNTNTCRYSNIKTYKLTSYTQYCYTNAGIGQYAHYRKNRVLIYLYFIALLCCWETGLVKLVRKISSCRVLTVSKDAADSCYLQIPALNRTSLVSFRPKCADYLFGYDLSLAATLLGVMSDLSSCFICFSQLLTGDKTL
jgi:hypothetical protein